MLKRPVLLILAFIITPALAEEKHLIIQATSNGLLGDDSKKAVKQTIYIKDDKMLMMDNVSMVHTIVRLDKKLTWHIFGKHQCYRETTFKSYGENRNKYLKTRKNALIRIRGITNSYHRKAAAKEWGFHVDWLANVSDTIKPELIKVGSPKKINGYNCVNYIIKVHGKEAMDVWVTDELKYPSNIFLFYTELGILEDGLVLKMKEIKGFPVKLTLKLDYMHLMKSTIETNLIKVKMGKVSDKLFKVPEGYELIDDRLPEYVKCLVCGKKVHVITAQKKGNSYTFYSTGRPLIGFFDCRKCRNKFAALQRKKTTEEEEEEEEDLPPEPEKPKVEKKPTPRPEPVPGPEPPPGKDKPSR